MTDVSRRLTVDAAVAEFTKAANQVFGPAPSAAASAAAYVTPEEAEAERFRFAEHVLSLACPDPRRCEDHRCRRNLCRHFADMRAVERGTRVLAPSRRSPGAWAVRYAIWVFINGA